MLPYLDNAGRLPIKIVVVKKILGNAIKEILTTKKTSFRLFKYFSIIILIILQIFSFSILALYAHSCLMSLISPLELNSLLLLSKISYVFIQCIVIVLILLMLVIYSLKTTLYTC